MSNTPMNTTQSAPMNVPCETACKQEKHMELHHAIVSGQSCVESLEHLLYKINNQSAVAPPACNEEQQQPTLLTILDHGPEALREINSNIHDLINRIDQCLF